MQGSTALHQAAMHGHARVVQSLLEYGADPNPRTADVSAPTILMLPGSCMTFYASSAHPLFRPVHWTQLITTIIVATWFRQDHVYAQTRGD